MTTPRLLSQQNPFTKLRDQQCTAEVAHKEAVNNAKVGAEVGGGFGAFIGFLGWAMNGAGPWGVLGAIAISALAGAGLGSLTGGGACAVATNKADQWEELVAGPGPSLR